MQCLWKYCRAILSRCGQLVCCGQPMQLLVTKTQDEGLEKHLPVIENLNSKVLVKVGSVPHPMDQNHYIVFIEIVETSGKICRKYLSPTDLPQAESDIKDKSQIESVREYCNIRGLWQI